MSQATLLFDGAFATATAALYAYVGRLVLARESAGPDARRANVLFAVWWLGLALVTLLGATRSVLVALGMVDLGFHVALSYVSLVPLVALLWGLVYYLVYIYTGNPRTFVPVTLLHVAILGFLLFLVAYLRPVGLQVNEWNVTFTYDRAPTGALVALTLVSILAPALLAAVGYGTLYFRTEDPTARYRIGLVSGAFILWFGSAVLGASVHAIGTWSAWPIASRVIGLVATLMILAAYKPPRALQERFGVRPLVGRRDHEHPPARDRLRPVPTALRAAHA